VLTMKATTQKKLAHNIDLLTHEFGTVPPAEVTHEVESVAEALLTGAHFDDYIPVLTHRFAREHLRERLATAA